MAKSVLMEGSATFTDEAKNGVMNDVMQTTSSTAWSFFIASDVVKRLIHKGI